ncbi:MAG: sulfurtransferase TusA family protein [Acetobacteraceae bacterium]|nr:sulfurtransferase TusA family protein [Acetobacteraceae bacterium]
MEQVSEAEPMHHLDISTETCPMTFVRMRLLLDRLPAGAVLDVRFRGEEPRRNLPRAAAEQGHTVLALEDLADGLGRLVLRKG